MRKCHILSTWNDRKLFPWSRNTVTWITLIFDIICNAIKSHQFRSILKLYIDWIGWICLYWASKRLFSVPQCLQNIDGFSCEHNPTHSAYLPTHLHFRVFYFHSLVLPRASVDKKPQSSRALLKHCVTTSGSRNSSGAEPYVGLSVHVWPRRICVQHQRNYKSKVWKCSVNVLLRRLFNSNQWFWWFASFTWLQHELASVCFCLSRYSCLFMCWTEPHS